MTTTPSARALPSVDRVLHDPVGEELVARHGRQRAVEAVRRRLESARQAIRAGTSPADGSLEPGGVAREAAAAIAAEDAPVLRPVVNATGIILHTGLGRARMPEEATRALGAVSGCCNLEHDLDANRRGRREESLRSIVSELTGAEDVLVVNNNAGATFLVLAALGRGREVVVSRGELIEIGGSFRLPEIMAESGVRLREVGTTNKTRRLDYEAAAGPETAILLKAHKSNYCMVGFTAEVGIGEIAAVGRPRGIPVVDDLGCGAMVDLEAFGLSHECTVRESLEAGADLALFSTDKLIGGPQGGMIVGRADLVEKVRSHPLYRILRVCKLTLAALEATLGLFRSPDLLVRRHPVYRMLGRTAAELSRQAEDVRAALAAARPGWEVTVGEEAAFLGGGSIPGESLPSRGVRIASPDLSADALARALRSAAVPVVPRVSEDRVVLDMRTVLPEDVPAVLEAARAV
jgi:L-seryl-tRNA(Ser) seleniumtransferase